MSATVLDNHRTHLAMVRPASARLATAPAGSPAADPDAVLDVALEALRFEHAHAEAARSRAAGLLTACGVLLALTAGLGSAAAQAARSCPMSARR